ncbi:MAG: ATP-binding protein [Actinomycetes bacterium]
MGKHLGMCPGAGSDPRLVVAVSLPAEPSSVRRARQLTRSTLNGRECVDLAELVVSEMVTNALQHAGGVCTLRLQYWPGRVRLEVEDGNPVLPVPSRSPPDAMQSSGRGLRVIEAVTDRNGANELPDGKLMWAEFDCP